jgi:hypothetical protein
LHPSWKNDLRWFFFKDFSELPDFTGPKYMQLRPFDGRLFHNSVGYSWIAEETPAAVEPEVPYYMIHSRDWKAAQTFNFALLAQSSQYVTRAADRLIGVFAEYIDFR